MARFITAQVEKSVPEKLQHFINHIGVLRTINLTMLAFIILILPVTLVVSHQRQTFHQKAAELSPTPTPTPPDGCYYKCTQTACQLICSASALPPAKP